MAMKYLPAKGNVHARITANGKLVCIFKTAPTDAQGEVMAAALNGSHADLLKALRDLMCYVGGWDESVDHPCGRAARLLAQFEG